MLESFQAYLDLSLGLNALDQSDSLAHLGLLANVRHLHFLFTSLHHGTRVTCITWALLYRERLSSETGLVQVTGATLTQNTISGHHITDFQDDNITWHQKTSGDSVPGSITKHITTHRERDAVRDVKRPGQVQDDQTHQVGARAPLRAATASPALRVS
jgi:hypothetical protein